MLRVHSGGVNTTVPVSSIDLRLDNTAGQTLETTACTSSFGSCRTGQGLPGSVTPHGP